MNLTIDQLIKNGNHYKNIKNYDAMINCYLKAIDHNSDIAMYKLAVHYKNMSDYENMIKYYKMAINSGNDDALSELNITNILFIIIIHQNMIMIREILIIKT